MTTPKNIAHVVVIGAGIGGLTTAALLAQAGYHVTVFESQIYPGGSAGTFYHKGYRFDAGATVAGGFQTNGPHTVAGKKLGIDWRVRLHEPAWVVHLPDRDVALTQDNSDVVAKFPDSERFWQEQSQIAGIGWTLAAQGIPWPPQSAAEFTQLLKVGLRNLPRDLQIIPFAFGSVYQWAKLRGLGQDTTFLRFLDAQLLISAQTTSRYVNAVYGATALDLARQGVYHVSGGVGGLAETLADKIAELSGEIIYRQTITHIEVEEDRVTGVYTRHGKRGRSENFTPCDFVVANLTPWSLDELLGENSPKSLRTEVNRRADGSGAFVLHVGVLADKLPYNLPDHHQIITEMSGSLGEGRSIFISLSPLWDATRAPAGHRAVTITTHTAVRPWWDLLKRDPQAYDARKQEYTENILAAIEKSIPGFRASIRLTLPGTPVTYNFYTGRHLGMVGGFPQTSLFTARGPRTGIRNLRLVGDSIFPGQSTAGVTLGAMRVADDVKRNLPLSSQNTETTLLVEAL